MYPAAWTDTLSPSLSWTHLPLNGTAQHANQKVCLFSNLALHISIQDGAGCAALPYCSFKAATHICLSGVQYYNN